MYSLKMFRLVFAKSAELATFQRMSLRLLRQPFIDDKRQKKKSVCLCIHFKVNFVLMLAYYPLVFFTNME